MSRLVFFLCVCLWGRLRVSKEGGKAAAREEGGKSGDVVASFGMAELTDCLGDSKVLIMRQSIFVTNTSTKLQRDPTPGLLSKCTLIWSSFLQFHHFRMCKPSLTITSPL